MPCYRPLTGYRARDVAASGRRPIVFNVADGYADMEVKLPCGQCIGCKLEHSRQWAMRCVHEASLYDANSYITLTYDDDSLPRHRSVDVYIAQLFLKRFRKRYGKARYFLAGEYGDKFERPHYHAILFDHKFEDQKFFKMHNGNKLYRSASLEDLWKGGYSTIGGVTFESAAYVARYCVKKVTGEKTAEH